MIALKIEIFMIMQAPFIIKVTSSESSP